MTNSWPSLRKIAAPTAVALLCFTYSFASIRTEGNASSQSTTVSAPQTAAAAEATSKTPAPTKPKAVAKPKNKSVLDADVLESPISYLRNAFSAEEEDTDSSFDSGGAVVMTVKALVATLLSTVL